MKKLMMSILLGGLVLSGCASGSASENSGSDKLHIVATVYPEYDWLKQITAGTEDRIEVTLLLDQGTDLHNYQPTAADMIKIAEADMFVYVGGESDAWVKDALESSDNDQRIVVSLMDVLGNKAREEETVEGMEAEDEEEEEETEYDEHVWLSLQNAELFVDALKDACVQMDSEDSELFEKNAGAYKDKLNELDEQYRSLCEKASVKTLLFADRFPFLYLVKDYGLDYYAAFRGCSAESEASFETVVFLAGKVDELSLPAILTIESSDQKIAETVRDNTKKKDAEILVIDSMQSATKETIDQGIGYLDIMEKNLAVLERALK